MRYKIRNVLGLLSSLALASSPASATEPYQPRLVIQAMSHVNPKLKIMVAHRGAYADNCPENSKCAIDRAVANNIEAVEIDVKETRDGVLWPSHDIRIGRGFNYTVNGALFDPFVPGVTGANQANNPLIADRTADEMRELKLRDMSGRVTNIPSISLIDLLRYTRDTHPNVVVVLAIKYASSVSKAALQIKALGMANQVILKFSMDFFSPLEISQHTNGYHFVPTLYAGSLDHIAETRHLNLQSYYDRVFTYVNDYHTIPGFVYYELGNKMFYPNGSSISVQGPMQNLTERLYQTNVPIGNFNPVTEHFGDAQHPATGFYHTDGLCCTRLDEFLTVTKHFGRETRDDRPNLEWQIKYNASVISDNAVEGRGIAARLGSRQDEYTLIH